MGDKAVEGFSLQSLVRFAFRCCDFGTVSFARTKEGDQLQVVNTFDSVGAIDGSVNGPNGVKGVHDLELVALLGPSE